MNKITVTDETARFFEQMVRGSYNGDMASKPHHPVLFELCTSHRIRTTAQFRDFLRQIADHLDSEDLDF